MGTDVQEKRITSFSVGDADREPVEIWLPDGRTVGVMIELGRRGGLSAMRLRVKAPEDIPVHRQSVADQRRDAGRPRPNFKD